MQTAEGVDRRLRYRDNVKIGAGRVTVVGIGDYDGQIAMATFEIGKATPARARAGSWIALRSEPRC